MPIALDRLYNCAFFHLTSESQAIGLFPAQNPREVEMQVEVIPRVSEACIAVMINMLILHRLGVDLKSLAVPDTLLLILPTYCR